MMTTPAWNSTRKAVEDKKRAESQNNTSPAEAEEGGHHTSEGTTYGNFSPDRYERTGHNPLSPDSSSANPDADPSP